MLGTFRGEDKTAMDDAAVRAAEACAVYIRDGAAEREIDAFLKKMLGRNGGELYGCDV